jgi:SagB-type dehydrogenase family enzyme
MNTLTDQVKAYHQRTKHQLQRYAAGPETLDWDAQPDPFRAWAGSPLTVLPLVADTLLTPWSDLAVPGRVSARAVSRSALGALFELSLALTAWKQQGPDRWALRANPSSGNLHPTEAYLMARGVPGLADGLYHYAPREHALALRALMPEGAPRPEAPQLWVGLSSVQWREAWKYGERAFRYCQLDAGHALGALRYASAVLGWQARVVPGVGHAELAALMGLDRDADFGLAEREEPELLVQILPMAASALGAADVPQAPSPWMEGVSWHGQANRLDAHPMYRWPVIEEVARATRGAGQIAATASHPSSADQAGVSVVAAGSEAMTPIASARHAWPAAQVIRERRSAQHFDRRGQMPAEAFFRLLRALMPAAGMPWDAWPATARVHPVIFAHRIDGLASGAYVLPRSSAGQAQLANTLLKGQAWQPVKEAPADLPLFGLVENPGLAGTMRTLSCHQAIASDACLAVSLLAEFDEPVDADPSAYRSLFQEAGLIGQVLYLQAEAEGYRGTGIGCYFDDAVHELLGMAGSHLQVLYQFTVGVPVVDTRISTEPPYAHRASTSELA